MEDVSRVTGNNTVFSWKDKEYVLSGFTFEDWGVLQDWLVRDKRRKHCQVVIDLRHDLPPDVWEQQFTQAKKEATEIGEIGAEEIQKFLASNEGVSLFLWVILERRYPGVFKRTEMLEVLATGAITAEKLAVLLQSMQTVLGNAGGN